MICDLAVTFKIVDSICIVTLVDIDSSSPVLIFQVRLSIPEVERPRLNLFFSGYPFIEKPIGINGEEI
jgi:hypothetical protein